MPIMSFCEMEKTQNAVTESMARRGLKQKELKPPSAQQYLLQRANQQVDFVPWGHRDIHTLAEALPPLGGGASPWIRLFEKLTARDTLALGDVRALMIRREGNAALTMLEAGTKTANEADEAPFNHHRVNFWAAMRGQWPTAEPDMQTALIGMRKQAGEDMYQYLRRAEEDCLSATGVRHDRNPMDTMFWRHIVQEGLPSPVQAKLKEVVCLDGMDIPTWRAHLYRHDQSHTDAKARQEDDLKKLQLRWVKIQLAKFDTDAHEKKQQAKKEMTVIVAPQAPQTGGRGSVLFGHVQATVVGLKYYTGKVNQGNTVRLVRAPHNLYDGNAVMVNNIHGDLVGYINRHQAAAMAHVMDNNLAEVEGVVYYGMKNPHSFQLMLSFLGEEENKSYVIESMARCGYQLKEMEPPPTQQYGGYQAGGYGQPGNQRGSDQCYYCGEWGHWAEDCQSY